MVLGHEPDEKSAYQYRMLTANRINGLLPCSVHNINGETYLYYMIDARISIENQYAVRKMKNTDLERLMLGIENTLRKMDEYLLSEDGLVFDVKAVYTGLSTGEYSFVYCPGKEKTGTFSEFSEQLLELTDHEDEQAVQKIYRLCEIAENSCISLKDMLKIVKNEDSEPENSNDSPQEKNESTEWEAQEYDAEPEYAQEHSPEEEEPGILRNLILSGLFAIVFASGGLIRMWYELTYRENVLSLTVMTISLLMAVLSLYFGVRRYKAGESGKKDKKMTDRKTYEEENYHQEAYPAEDIREKNGIFPQKQTNPEQDGMDYGETIVLNADNINRISRLYSRDTDTSIQIGLEHLPLTLGKMSGCVDQVLFHSSVSRIHARIYKDPERGVCIKDLNSTNGTFHNGIRLQPEESAELLPGDEICFGSLVFDYR
jgi:hypothetical protein